MVVVAVKVLGRIYAFSGKFPLNNMPIGLAGFEPRAWEVRAVGAVGKGLRFKRNAARLVQGHFVFSLHRIVEMLREIELQACLCRKEFD